MIISTLLLQKHFYNNSLYNLSMDDVILLDIRLRRRRTRKSLVMSQRRYEGACNRIVDTNVTFCDKGGTVQQETDFFPKKIGTSITCSDVVNESIPNFV